ncbi:hypothetical protein OB955_17585 [Halobacteria archaeon AArc-m2/3/4]|uniref:Uncharacterized protein n=1 Tax=Natronoglomus mannanivorans TaxID=2979990 RepID=A0AAP2YZP3_9EURY|nr:hypothetical protein [Halobacteria archaeon AArc-xg1-1]MCU4974535.1 hypothetical protein [Halobacteria archaeon AArc-m2/3/4]
MVDDALWDELREQCERLESGTELTTPVSGRRFEIERADETQLVVRFRDSSEERSLSREQFEVLAGRLDDGPIPIETLTPGVEPYATVLTLSESYGVDDGTITTSDETVAGESPYLVSPEAARSQAERVHDDALLLAALLSRLDATKPASLETEPLTDLYVLLSDVQRGSDRLRGSTGDAVLERLGPDQTLRGRFGSVHRTTRRYRHLKDEETVLDALDEYGIPHEWVLGVDTEKLDVVLATTELDEAEVYDVDERVYAQKTGVDEAEKFEYLQGLADRIEDLEGEKGEELLSDLEGLEDRLEEALSAG